MCVCVRGVCVRLGGCVCACVCVREREIEGYILFKAHTRFLHM